MKPKCEDFDWGNVGRSAVGGMIGGTIGGGLIGFGGDALREASRFGVETGINFDLTLWSSVWSNGVSK